MKKQKIIAPDFIQIPYDLITDSNLQALDRILYGFIYWFAKLKNEKCTASNVTLAGLCGVKNPQVISNCLNRLEEQGYIKREYFDESKRKRAEIVPLVFYIKFKPDTSIDVSNTSPDVSHDTSIDVENKNILNKNKKDIIPDEPEKSFNFNDYWKSLRNSKSRINQIIAVYWDYKGFEYESKDQANAALRRDLRAGKALNGYTEEKIQEVIVWLDDNADFKWTLETVHKYIDEDLSKIKFGKKVYA